MSGTTYIVLQRPYPEVASAFEDVFRSREATVSRTLTETSKISIDSRYGMWDPDSGTVVATR